MSTAPTSPAMMLDCAASIARREMTATAAVEAALRNVARHEPALGALLHVASEQAMTRAAQLDEALDAGRSVGPLAGVPVTVKDVISVPGMPLTAASKILAGYTPPYAATVTKRLLAAGAVIIGKNNLDEFAMGSSNENSAYKSVANPWDLQRVPGGSSGGSAAAVAAGYGYASLGTDTGGSVRLPAALCGVVGLKPTYGRVSRHGVVAFASSLDQVGPIARSVSDVAQLLDVIAGPCPLDATCVNRSAPNTLATLSSPIEGLVVGVPREFLDDAEGLHPGVRASVHAAIEQLRDLGCKIHAVRLPHSPHCIATYYVVATAEASANLQRFDGVRYGLRTALQHGEGIDILHARTRQQGFGDEVKRRIMLGTFALSSGYYDAYYDKACRVRRLIYNDYVEALQGCDVLVGPTSPLPAWQLGERSGDPLSLYLMDIFTTGASLAGVPALSVPIAPTEGLPTGLQIIGRHFDEATVLRVGHQLCEATGAHLAAPSMAPSMT